MSYHILHLLSHDLRVRIDLDRVAVTKDGETTHVPVEDVAMVIAATPRLSLTAGVLRRFAEERIPLLICDETFQPASLTLPYYRATDTELLRSQIRMNARQKTAIWRRVIAAKIENQAAVLDEDDPVCDRLLGLAARVDSKNPARTESTAARAYWRRFFTLLKGDERTRAAGTRSGVNGMLDYGYAVVRSAVLRALAVRGFIAALGIHHADQAGHFALADDLMEPLRPFADARLLEFLSARDELPSMREWAPEAAAVLTAPVTALTGQVRLLYAVDRYVESVAAALLRKKVDLLWIPRL